MKVTERQFKREYGTQGLLLVALAVVVMVFGFVIDQTLVATIFAVPILGFGVIQIQRWFTTRGAIDEAPLQRPGTPAGWYPHPEMPRTQRYWDGNAWTDHVAPADSGSGRQVSTLTIARGVALGIGIAIAGFVILGQIAGADDSLECETDNADRVLAGLPPEPCP
jgi:hypothetical protein